MTLKRHIVTLSPICLFSSFKYIYFSFILEYHWCSTNVGQRLIIWECYIQNPKRLRQNVLKGKFIASNAFTEQEKGRNKKMTASCYEDY